jgi:hypothetical protein
LAPTTAPGTATTKELDNYKTLKPTIDKLSAALKSGNLQQSRDAYEVYDAAWNGIETYINVRSRQLYADMETDLQAKIANALDEKSPKLSDIAANVDALSEKYETGLQLITAGPPLSSLFDDLATLRIVRSDLRIASAALGASNAAKGEEYYAKFKANYAKAKPLITARSASDDAEVTAAMSAIDTKIAAGGADASLVTDLKPLVATLMDRYNYGVNLLNAAARNADLKKTAATDDDMKNVTALAEEQMHLKASLAAWTTGNYAASSSEAAAANASFAKASPALAAKAADVQVKTALDAYTALAGSAGDKAKTESSEKAAVEAASIAQQVVLGQFWKDGKVEAFVAALPK